MATARPALPLVLLALSGCSGSRPPPPPPSPTAERLEMKDVLEASGPHDWAPLDPTHALVMDLPGGRVVIALAPAFAPAHVDRILALVREGYFDGLSVYRVQDGYVAQWGDPDADEPGKAKVIKAGPAALPAEFTRPTAGLPFTPLPDRDVYAPQVGFSGGFPAARDVGANQAWLTHCYGTVGVARGDDPATGDGATLFAVIGNAPRALDRNITVVGRVVQGMEFLASLPRGPAPMGFHEKPELRTPIRSVRVLDDLPPAERPMLELLQTEGATWDELVESRRNRGGSWYKTPAGKIDVCSVPLPVRKSGG